MKIEIILSCNNTNIITTKHLFNTLFFRATNVYTHFWSAKPVRQSRLPHQLVI